MGSIKLLNKTLSIYLLCSSIVLMIAAPIFYFSIEHLYLKDTDETLLLYKKEFKYYFLPTFKQNNIPEFNRYNRNLKILPPSVLILNDTFSNAFYLDSLDNENEPYRVFKTPIYIENKPYTFYARISLVESEDLIKRIAVIFVGLIGFLLITLLFITKQFSKRIWLPFQKTLDKLLRFDLTKEQSISFDKTDIKEFDELNLALQNLVDKNISVFSQQKAFIENASHELQTPLAILKTKLNLLLQNNNINSDQAALLAAIEIPLTRMTRINKNLLMLAKIENKQYLEVESIELEKVITETLELLEDYLITKQIILIKKINQKLTVKSNKTLIEILVSNLLINSVVHNSKNGEIIIELSDQSLIVSNTGNLALNKQKIFKRFTITSSETVSSGLGLAIVKEICNRYNWKIIYHFENGFHSFSVNFS